MNPIHSFLSSLTESGHEGGQLRIVDQVKRVASIVRARAMLRGCELGERVCAYGPIRLVRKGRVAVGAHTFFRTGSVPVEIVCDAGGNVEIGDHGAINYGVSIDCAKSIHIGSRCLLGSFVRISDRGRGGPARVWIGDDVWIAHGAMVEPGVTIGDGAVVSAGAVVTGDVPPRTMAVGNPARAMPLQMARGTR